MLKGLASFAEIRAREFARLGDHAYLDYTGSALYGESQLLAHHALLERGLFGNPHSDSSAARASTEIVEAARRRVLRFFDVDESTHDLCFTSNTSAAIKLVAESYQFSDGEALALSVDNHNSVNGIREYARRAGASVRCLPLDGELRLRDPLAHLGRGPGLLAFPAQSNFSGVLTVQNVTTDTFTVQNGGTAVNTSASGNGNARKITQQQIPTGVTASFAAAALTATAA